MAYIFQPMKIVGLYIKGTEDKFPVRRVYCVGRNYAAHAREMGSDPNCEPPFFFCKHNDSESIVPVAKEGTVDVPYPSQTENYHYEVELVVAIGKDAKNISADEAKNIIYGYAVGLDMTRRDLQIKMREKGRPWEIGKAFDYSAPIGEVTPISDINELNEGTIKLTVNGETKQESNLTHMTWSVSEIISRLSELFELKAGDLIMTGTPEGVGSVMVGDKIVAKIDNLAGITVNIKS